MSATTVDDIQSRRFPGELDTYLRFPDYPSVNAQDISMMDFDPDLKYETAMFVGKCLSGDMFSVERVEETGDTDKNLHIAILGAREGSAEDRENVASNVRTDRFERRQKSGFIMPIHMDVRNDGEITQHGQTLVQTTRNSLVYLKNEKLRQRAKGPEARNGMRQKELYKRGELKQNYMLTTSLVHGEMDDEEAEEAGFFTRTRSAALQLATENAKGLELKSAFVAGQEGPHEEDIPFDLEAVVELAKMLGVSYSGLSTEEILDRPLLVPKSILPNGIASLIRLYDIAVGHVTGKPKFFGRDVGKRLPEEAYVKKELEDLKAIKNAESEVQETVDELINSNVNSPLEATARLAVLNERQLKEAIIYDTTIDAHVLGDKVAWEVYHARELLKKDQVDYQQVELLQRRIDIYGSSNSCPGGAKNDDEFDGNNQESISSTKLEDCEFTSKECPKCGQKNVKTECKDGVYIGECGCRSDK